MAVVAAVAATYSGANTEVILIAVRRAVVKKPPKSSVLFSSVVRLGPIRRLLRQ